MHEAKYSAELINCHYIEWRMELLVFVYSNKTKAKEEAKIEQRDQWSGKWEICGASY